MWIIYGFSDKVLIRYQLCCCSLECSGMLGDVMESERRDMGKFLCVEGAQR